MYLIMSSVVAFGSLIACLVLLVAALFTSHPPHVIAIFYALAAMYVCGRGTAWLFLSVTDSFKHGEGPTISECAEVMGAGMTMALRFRFMLMLCLYPLLATTSFA